VSLSLLTLNCGLLRLGLLGRALLEPAPYIRERFAALPEALRAVDADIVALQEIYRVAHKRALIAALAEHWPHAAYPLKKPWLKLDCGLLVLSRHPIPRESFHPFRAATGDERRFVHRGFLATDHAVPGLGTIRLLSFHTTAGGLRHDPEAAFTDAVRGRQIDEILDFAERDPATPHVLIGDLNAGPPVSMGNYRQVLERGYVDLYAALHGTAAERAVTWDAQQPLNRRGPHAHQRPQRIDHVFLHRRWLDRFAATDAKIVLTEPVVPVPGGARVTVADHYGVYVRVAGA
jgi:sphingomyelin phosphodiesterase 2